MTTNANKLTDRAKIFDLCFAELSPYAQQDLKNRIEYLVSVLDNGGDLSAKELIIQFARFVNGLPKEILT